MIKPGTVCYVVGCPPPHNQLNGRVVTVTGPLALSGIHRQGPRIRILAYPVTPHLPCGCCGITFGKMRPQNLLPISDPTEEITSIDARELETA